MTDANHAYARRCAAAAHAFVRLVQINDRLRKGDMEPMTHYLSEDELELWGSLIKSVDEFGRHELHLATRVHNEV